MRKGFTLIEMIFVIVISALLSMGSFKAMEALYVRSAKAQAITELTLRSQIVLDQVSMMLYNRIPNSVIGYSPNDTIDRCESLNILTKPHTVLEWLGTMDDELLRGDYDGFVDMGDSNKTSKTLSTRSIKSSLNSADVNLIFSGAFDEGSEESTKACSGAFGWHGNNSDLSFQVTINENSTTITDLIQPDFIYEKYYLTKTAYAIARGADLLESDLENNCANYSPPSNSFDFNTTLFLFSNYQPFNSETFCGDLSGTRAGDVSILSEDVNAFEATYINDSIIINLDINRSIRGSTYVHITKQKAVF